MKLYEDNPYIEHFVHNHISVSRDCIEIVLDSKRSDQYRDSNHDKLYNRMDQEHARILLEDRLSMMKVVVVLLWEYMRQDKLPFERSMKCLEGR